MSEDKKNSSQEDDFEKRFMRDIFPNIKPPEEGYQLGDKVAHIDGIVYEIRGVKGNGNYVLGYTERVEGVEVEIEAPQDDFRDISDVTSALVSANIREGRIDPEKVIGIQMPRTPKTEGLGRATDIGGKVQEEPKPPSRN